MDWIVIIKEEGKRMNLFIRVCLIIYFLTVIIVIAPTLWCKQMVGCSIKLDLLKMSLFPKCSLLLFTLC